MLCLSPYYYLITAQLNGCTPINESQNGGARQSPVRVVLAAAVPRAPALPGRALPHGRARLHRPAQPRPALQRVPARGPPAPAPGAAGLQAAPGLGPRLVADPRRARHHAASETQARPGQPAARAALAVSRALQAPARDSPLRPGQVSL